MADRLIKARPCILDDGTEVSVAWLCDRCDGWRRKEASVGAEKSTHRVTMDVPTEAVTSWQEFKKPPFPWAAARQLEVTASRYDLGDPGSWYVINRSIPQTEWVEVVCIENGRVIWNRERSVL
jgi:hypothetical protein